MEPEMRFHQPLFDYQPRMAAVYSEVFRRVSRGLMEPVARLHQPLFDYQPQTAVVYSEVSNEMQQQQPGAINNQQQLSFWNASSGFHTASLSSPKAQFLMTKPSCSKILELKPSCSKSTGREKKNSSEPAVKRRLLHHRRHSK